MGGGLWVGLASGVSAQTCPPSPEPVPHHRAPECQAVDQFQANDERDERWRVLTWTPGLCQGQYRVWQAPRSGNAWRLFAETTDPWVVIPTPTRQATRWRVSALCNDGSEWVARGGEVTVPPGPWEQVLTR